MPETLEKPQRLLDRHPWLVFLLPFVVYMLVGSLEPTPEKPGGADIGLAIAYADYPWVYTAKIVLTLAAMACVLPGYRQFPPRVSLLGILVGVVGVVVWVGACKLDLERRVLGPLGLDRLIDLGVRPGYNPLARAGRQPAGRVGLPRGPVLRAGRDRARRSRSSFCGAS